MQHVRMILICFCLLNCGAIAQAEPSNRLSLIPFDFVDTSGELRVQQEAREHLIALFHNVIRDEALGAGLEIGGISACQPQPCSIRRHGIEALSKKAAEMQMGLLLLGEIKKMSTLVGQVKFAVIDLNSNRVLCDRYLTYRGDTEEAWRRAGKFLVRDLKRHCLKG